VTAVARVLVWARRRRWVVLAAVMAFAGLAAAQSLRVSFGTDVLALLPQRDPSLAAFRQYLERFGGADDLFIVFAAPGDGQIEDASGFVDAYVRRLRALPEISRVDAGLFDSDKDWTYLQERTFVLIGPDATREALGRFSEAGLRTALLRSRDLLGTPSPDVRALVQTDPLGLFSVLRDHFAGDRTFAGLDVGRRGYTSSDGGSRLVMAVPARPAFDSEFCRRLFDRLTEVEAQARAEIAGEASSPGATPVRIDYAGGHRIAVETEAIMKQEALLNSVTSVSAILLLLVLVFRSAWLFLVGALPMAVATLGTIAINGLLREQLSAAATGTSALLFGLGIDGLVLMYARYLEQLEEGTPASDAIRGLGGAGTSMLLGCFTTAATFLALTWIDVPGLQELGRLVGIGMLLGGPLTLVLAAVLLPARVKRPRALRATWLARFVRRYRWGILVAASLVTAAAVPLAARLDVDLRLQRLQPATPAVRLQQEIAQRFGLDRNVALALAQGPALDALLIADRRFEAAIGAHAPGVPASGPSRLLPPADEQAATSRVLAAAASELPAIRARFSAVASDVGFRPGVFDAFLEKLPRLLDAAQRLTYDGYVDHGLGDILSRYVAKRPDGYATVAYVELSGPGDFARAREAASATGVTLTGVPVVNAALAVAFGPQLAKALAGGSVVVFLLILITFRSLRLALLAVLPTILGLVWAAALLAALGVSLDLFSVFGVLTLIGIGVDYGIHLVHRAAAEPDALDTALARVAPSNIVAAGIALLGCGSLAVSTYPPLRSLGIVTVVGLCTCLLTAVLVLPALLMTGARARR
jgi:predicted RND superfamily exporter protein